MITLRSRIAAVGTAGALTAVGLALAAPSAVAAPASCGNGALAVSNTSTQGAAGHGSVVLLLRNSSGSSCTLSGYPSLDAINASGQVLAHAQRTLNGYSGGASAVTTVTLAAGDTASATAEWLNFNGATGGDCTFSSAINTIPPATTAATRLNVAVSVCSLQIHPVVAGSSGSTTPTGVPAGSGGVAATTGSANPAPEIALTLGGLAVALTGVLGLLRGRRRPGSSA